MRNLFLISLFSLNLCATESQPEYVAYKIDDKAFFVPYSLGKVEFYMKDDHFIAVRDNHYQLIAPYMVDKQIRNFKQEELNKFLNVGYLAVSENDQGELSLKAHVRGLGGGPILGSICWAGTHFVAYTAFFCGILGTNTVAPGLGPIASTMVVGGSIPAFMAATQVVALKAGLWGLIVCPWL